MAGAALSLPSECLLLSGYLNFDPKCGLLPPVFMNEQLPCFSCTAALVPARRCFPLPPVFALAPALSVCVAFPKSAAAWQAAADLVAARTCGCGSSLVAARTLRLRVFTEPSRRQPRTKSVDLGDTGVGVSPKRDR